MRNRKCGKQILSILLTGLLSLNVPMAALAESEEVLISEAQVQEADLADTNEYAVEEEDAVDEEEAVAEEVTVDDEYAVEEEVTIDDEDTSAEEVTDYEEDTVNEEAAEETTDTDENILETGSEEDQLVESEEEEQLIDETELETEEAQIELYDDEVMVQETNISGFPTEIPAGETYKLTEDITLTEGQQIKNLAGTLDGQGHTITFDNAGAIFASLSVGAVVQNVSLKGTMTGSSSNVTGPFGTTAYGASILNCRSEISGSNVAGFIGKTGAYIGADASQDRDGVIANCIAVGDSGKGALCNSSSNNSGAAI